MKSIFHYSLLLNLIMFASCNSSDVANTDTTNPIEGNMETEVEVTPVSKIDFKVPMHWAGHKDENIWNEYLKSALHDHGQDLLKSKPSDIARYADHYSSFSLNERYSFWAHLITLIAKRESNFNTNTKYAENFSDGTGNKVVSRGLLQLSYRSALNYDCPLKSESDLHNAKKNLICGVKILNNWVKKDKVISRNSDGWKGGARYWSVLRNTKSHVYIRSHSLSVF